MAVSSQQRRKSKFIPIGVVVGLGVLLLCAVWKSSIFGRAADNLHSELKAAHGDGLPLTADDIRNSSVVASDDNAAPLLMQAFSELKTFEATSDGKALAKITKPGGGVLSLTSDDLAEIAPLLTHLTHFFDVLKQASLKPKIDFHRQWEKGPALLLPELAEEKSTVAPLILLAKIDLKAGKPLEAIESLETAARISTLVGKEPLIISLLVQVAIRAQVCQELTEVIKANPYATDVVDRSRVVLKDLGPVPDVRPGIRSEFLMGQIAVQMLASQDASEVFGTEAGNGVVRLARFGPIRTVYALRVAEVYHRLYRALSQRPDSIVEMQKVFANTEGTLDKDSSKDWTYGLVEILAPTFTQMAAAIGESEAKKDVLLCALDLLDAKKATGQFPRKLLGNSGYWLDPFTERPMTYRSTKRGFLIYSFGRDGKDDGGKPRSPKSNDQNYDIPFSFP